MTEALTDALANVEEPQEVDQPVGEAQAENPFLETLVGDGKKYKSADELARAYHHANIHIEELKGELGEVRGSKEALSELITEIRNSQPAERVEPPAQPVASEEPQIQTADIASIVDQQLQVKEAEANQRKNVNATMEKLVGVYGSQANVKAAITKAVTQDPAVQKTIDDLSLSSPDMAVKFVTGIVEAGEPASNSPGVQAATKAPAPTGGLTWSQCRELKKSNPKEYNSPAFRQRIEAAAQAAADRGEDFFAT